MAASVKKENSIFFNYSFDKKRLKALISWVFKHSGEAEALKVLDQLKETGFRHATKAGISIGLHDLTTPIQKSWLISESQLSMNTTDRDFIGARITATERSQRIIDTWHRASESLSKQVVDYFGIYDNFNPVYIMALSGARGNFSQVRQLIGMRGLMADQQGKIVNFPIRSNLREGLTLTEYFISCSGARKGLVDTALRTADTGYLTRRLVDVSHHVVVKRIRCNTTRGITFKSLQSYNKVLLPLKERLIGRVLAENIQMTSSSLSIAKKDQEISPKLSLKIAQVRDKVFIRSPLTCGFTHSVCQLCYGWSISQGSLVSLGDAVGVIAAQSIGEPGTQLTMRTFHTGGVFSGDLLQEIRSPHAGKIEFSKAFQGLLIRTAHGRIAFLSKTQGSLILTLASIPQSSALHDPAYKIKKENSFTEIPIPAFTMLFVRQGENVEKNQLLAEFSIRSKEGNQPIKTQQTVFAELSGRVIEDCSGKVYTKPIKESVLFSDSLHDDSLCKESTFMTYKENKNRRLTKHSINSKTSLKSKRLTKVSQNKPSYYLPSFSYKCNWLNPYLQIFDLYAKFCNKYFRSALKSGALYGVCSSSSKATLCRSTDKDVQSSYAQLRFVRQIYASYLHAEPSFVSNPKTNKKVQNQKEKYLSNRLFFSCMPGKRSFLNKVRKIPSFSLHTKPYNPYKPCKLDRPYKVELRKSNKISKRISMDSRANLVTQICKSQIASSVKSEDLENDIFKYIEPVRSGRLGFLKILSTRVGATLDYTCPIKSFDSHLIKRKKKQKSDVQIETLQRKGIKGKNNKSLFFNFAVNYLHPEYRKENRFFLQTIAEYGDIVDEAYNHKAPLCKKNL